MSSPSQPTAPHSGLEISVSTVMVRRRRLAEINVLYEQESIHVAQIDPSNASTRMAFAHEVAARLSERMDDPPNTRAVDQMLLNAIERQPDDVPSLESRSPRTATSYSKIDEDNKNQGLYREAEDMTRLTNFVATIDVDRYLQDEGVDERVFRGQITLGSSSSRWEISSADYANDQTLRASLYKAGGVNLQFLSNVSDIRNAISAVSAASSEQYTTKFGYGPTKAIFAMQSGFITADGYSAENEDAPLVFLSDVEVARHLDLKQVSPEKLDQLQYHVANELCILNDPQIICLTLAYSMLPVLWPHTEGYGRFSMWIVGPTGSGKSFLAKLCQNFYGDFPVESGRFMSWASTVNSLQHQGFFFGDALALIDDYKPETTSRNGVIRLIQTYADGTARGRLNSNATTNTSRPYRGWLLATGEDVPEQTASALARMIVVQLPNREKNIEIGHRCVELAHDYSAITADFVARILSNGLGISFTQRVHELLAELYRDIAGHQNDIRIASNFALLLAAFEFVADYFTAANHPLPITPDEMRDHLWAMRDQMLASVSEQSPGQIFIDSLRSLFEAGRVQIPARFGTGRSNLTPGDNSSAVVGRTLPRQEQGGQDLCEINIDLALHAVNPFLSQQNRPRLSVSPKALLNHLLDMGILVDPETGTPLTRDAAAELTRQATIDGRNVRVFCIAMSSLQR